MPNPEKPNSPMSHQVALVAVVAVVALLSAIVYMQFDEFSDRRAVKDGFSRASNMAEHCRIQHAMGLCCE